jgi:2,4-dienoyl-CoA reductase-like NADH-dependent reductase (Old Yellow Enzyme family)
MPDPHYLFAPMTVAGKVLPSRFLLAPLNTGFVTAGLPTDDLVNFHAARSGPEIGVSVVGNVAVSNAGVTNSCTAVLDEDSSIYQYSRLADAIQSRGSLAGIQLANTPVLNPARNWVARDRQYERMRLSEIVSDFSDDSLVAILNQFVAGVRLAATAGFDVIQIHAAHGYFLALLLNALTNRRSGHFALLGPWLRPFLAALLEASVGSIIGFRLSLISGLEFPPTDELEATISISQTLASAGIHFLDYSTGFYTVDRRMIYPGTEKGMLPFLHHVLRVADGLKCICGVSGNVQDVRQLPHLPDNFVVSIGRALIADPELLAKTRRGNYADVTQCRRTGKCHYFSRGMLRIECGVNPFVQHT